MRSKHSSILGIDISSTSVKILEIVSDGDHHCVVAYSRSLLPEGAMDGNVIQDGEALTCCIKKAMADLSTPCHQVALAVPEASTISKVIQINNSLRPQEMEEAVAIAAEQFMPFPTDAINIDFNIVGPSSKNPMMLDVLMVASKAMHVTQRVDAISRAGLLARIVDVESFALERAAALLVADLVPDGKNNTIAIMDIGAISTHLYVLHGMQIIFSREEAFGSQPLITAVRQRYNLSQQEAIAAIEQGILSENENEEIIASFNESVSLNAKRALHFFFSTSQYKCVDHLILAGGVAKQPGLSQLLQKNVSIPCHIANPFSTMNFAKNVNRQIITRDAPQLLVACGLALRVSE